jgi:hypothetical protein
MDYMDATFLGPCHTWVIRSAKSMTLLVGDVLPQDPFLHRILDTRT